MLFRTLGAATVTVAAALLLVSSSLGRTAAAPTLRGSVGPGFTIKLTKSGHAVKALRAGTYKLVVNDRSAEHNFVLEREGGAERQITSVAFVGTRTVTLRLTKGVWKFYCEPHESVMFGRVSVADAKLARASGPSTTTTTVADDRGREAEAGDDRGAGEVEPGDDRGGAGEIEPGDDHGAAEVEAGDDHSGHSGRDG